MQHVRETVVVVAFDGLRKVAPMQISKVLRSSLCSWSVSPKWELSPSSLAGVRDVPLAIYIPRYPVSRTPGCSRFLSDYPTTRVLDNCRILEIYQHMPNTDTLVDGRKCSNAIINSPVHRHPVQTDCSIDKFVTVSRGHALEIKISSEHSTA